MSRFNRFLHGIKVVDVSFYIPGPMASLQLADMGAEVIKIEPPWGDDMRALGPRDAGGKPLFYDGTVLVDLKREFSFAQVDDSGKKVKAEGPHSADFPPVHNAH